MTEKDIQYASDVAFTPTVKDIQVRKGSRRGYERMETGGSWQTEITDDLAAFIESRTTVYLATVNSEGQPYVQHRGGPPGFLKVLNNRTIGFADFSGNRQYITQGNLVENPSIHNTNLLRMVCRRDLARRSAIQVCCSVGVRRTRNPPAAL